MGLFDKLESKLEQGVNGAFARAFKSEVQPVEIASGMRRAMDDRASSVKKGQRPVVPNLFTIELSPTDYERLSAWGDELDDELIASAQEHCEEQRYLPGGPLTIVLAEEDDLETGVFRLRPATAKAADALAHSRKFPRPEPSAAEVVERETPTTPTPSKARPSKSSVRDEVRPAATTSTAGAHPATPPKENLVENRSDGRGTSERSTSENSLGARIKGYLLGDTGAVAARPQPAGRYDERPTAHRDDVDEHEQYDDDFEAPSVTASRERRAPERSEHGPARDEAADTSNDAAFPHDSDVSGEGYDQYAGSSATQLREETPRPTASVKAAPMPRPGGTSGTPTPRPKPVPEAPRSAPASERTHTPQKARKAPAPQREHEETPATTRFETAQPAPTPNRPRTTSPRQRPWLKIDGQRYPLLGAITTLGRDDDADIVIDDPGVSRQHTEIRITHDGPHLVMSVRDLGSTNGTFINGDRIESQHARDGDRITVGRTHMTIHLGDRP